METIRNILDKYSLKEKTPVTLIRESADNFVYLVGEKDKYILRLSKKLPIEDISFEYDVSQYFYNNKFPVANWVKTSNGNVYATSNGTDIAVIFDFINGYHAKIDKENVPTKEQAYAAGAALGKMANLGKDFRSAAPRTRNIFSELERAIENKVFFINEFEGGMEFVKQVEDAIVFGKEDTSPIGLIHNDYRAGNVFFQSDKEVSGVIDFDWSCIGPLVKDVALGVLEWSFPDGRSEPDWEIFDIFLEGYNSVSSIKQVKGKKLYSWIQFAALSDVATFFCDRLSDSELKKRIQRSYMYKKYIYFSKL